ncbi:MAG: septum formation initiator family protein, partial [bacterium]|nr:septum formation initiator family protein [bacterium]MDW8163591.1 septum formation initiator family protein [Candidatus Omnitrophota bacterium]
FIITTVVFVIASGIRLKKLYTSYKLYKFYKNEIARLEKENDLIFKKIEKIKNDPFYIEKLLREEYGMIKEGEFIIKMGD